jgi:hypothetical protein
MRGDNLKERSGKDFQILEVNVILAAKRFMRLMMRLSLYLRLLPCSKGLHAVFFVCKSQICIS